MSYDLNTMKAAWARLSPNRPNWPRTFEACMEVRNIAAQIRIEARPRQSVKPKPRTPFIHTPPVFDRKRAASGDKDD